MVRWSGGWCAEPAGGALVRRITEPDDPDRVVADAPEAGRPQVPPK
ncbi:hypothetical protein [Streptomyces albogriseolus]